MNPRIISWTLKTLLVFLFSGLVIRFYYSGILIGTSGIVNHNEISDNTISQAFLYLFPSFIIFLIFGIYFYFINEKNKGKFKVSKLAMYIFGFLSFIILCYTYFASTSKNIGGFMSFFLAFKILFYLILPITIFSACLGFGKHFLKKIDGFEEEGKIFKNFTGLGVGFLCFILILFFLGAIHLYYIWTVLIVIVIFLYFGHKEIINFYEDFFVGNFEFEGYTNFFTSLFLIFIIITLAGTNLILIDRPYPIGWDDLGVYMNNPHLIATNHKLLSIGGLQTWELYTGIGYLMNSATIAFYLNSFSGIVCSIVIYYFLKSFLGNKSKFLNIGLLIVALYLAMPMTIFQLGKDMKLDNGLFALSLIGLYIIYYIFIKKEKNVDELVKNDKCEICNKDKNSQNIKCEHCSDLSSDKPKELFSKQVLIYIFIAGLIVGLCFAIKATTLMLFSAIIGLIIIQRLGFTAFIGYLALYFGFFTKFHLWDMLNVVYPKDNESFINVFSIICLLVGIICIALSFLNYSKKHIIKTILAVALFIVGFGIVITPWYTKNLTEIITNGTEFSISKLTSGVGKAYVPDYTAVYSEEEITKIEEEINARSSMNEDGQALDEDLGRYFGYEKGINNYLKLPYNLTYQLNQSGEYTEITFLFLALIPLILLFLPYKNLLGYILIFLLFLFEILYFFGPDLIDYQKQLINLEMQNLGEKFKPNFYQEFIMNIKNHNFLTNFFNDIKLPLGYIIIIGIYILIYLSMKYSLETKKDKIAKFFMVNLGFSIFYIFLWNIAAFGIVWYGIVMYMGFFIIISVGLYYMFVGENTTFNSTIPKVIGSLAILLIFGVYFCKSAIPHALGNLASDSYYQYKIINNITTTDEEGKQENIMKINEIESVFLYHSDYIKVLYELNIADDKKAEFMTYYKEKIKNYFKNNDYYASNLENLNNTFDSINDITEFNQILLYTAKGNILSIPENQKYELKKLNTEMQKIKDDMNYQIMNPKKEWKSDAIIYRMGTFLKYYISDNYIRLYEDSLIFSFIDYIYAEDENGNQDIEKTASNFKDLGFSYILADLNTPTIDKDTNHTLTKRFESLLKTITAEKVELIDTDSVCLKTGLEMYRKSSKTPGDLQNFIYMAGVNFESYVTDEETGEQRYYHRSSKLNACQNVIKNMIVNGAIDENNYSYLNSLNELKSLSEKEIMDNLNGIIGAGSRVLFKVK